MDAVLMPVHNEAETIGEVLDAVRGHFSGEIIVVDDGSTDATVKILADRSDVVVVRLDHNCGYGCALRIGFDIARELSIERVVTMDCDGQHEPAHIADLFAALGDDVDIASGSRYLPGSASCGAAPADRKEINVRVTDEVNRITGFGLTDAFCGFKAYRVSSLSLVTLTESGYAMPLELWAQACAKGLKVVEVPVDRIYCDRERTFGTGLDDPDARYGYYLKVWQRAVEEAGCGS